MYTFSFFCAVKSSLNLLHFAFYHFYSVCGYVHINVLDGIISAIQWRMRKFLVYDRHVLSFAFLIAYGKDRVAILFQGWHILAIQAQTQKVRGFTVECLHVLAEPYESISFI